MARRKSTRSRRAAGKTKGSAGKRRKPSSRKPQSRRSRVSQKTRAPSRPTVVTGLSLDRKLDILGVGLAGVGFLTLLSLLSSSRSSLTGAWLAFLERAIGWGSFLLPLGLVALGLWLILRHFERVPQVSLERVFGVSSFFLASLVLFHYLLTLVSEESAATLAELGRGGGLVGSVIFLGLRAALGWWGTVIVLFGWLLISLGMSLDVPIAALFRWAPPLIERGRLRLQAALQSWSENRRRSRQAPAPPETIRQPVGDPARTPAAAPHFPLSEDSPPTLAGPPITMEAESRAWVLPPVDQILDPGDQVQFDDEYDRQRARLIEETLASFGAPARVVEINRGPTITQYGVEPDYVETSRGRTRVRVSKIASLADDLALALAASRIRVQAPVPGKGYVGIEVPNEEVALVTLRDVIESEAFQRLQSPLRFALGQDVAGNAVAADLGAMPHLLIAGATGSGKSVAVNALICGMLLHNTPNELRLLMVDPKRVELTGYNGIPHLLAPVVVELDRVVGALQWVTREMDQRYHKLSQDGARHIQEYNARRHAQGESPLPYLVVVIDELADLMMLAPDETERTITRLAQLARATGIHLVISTQRPSVDVVTGLIKANFPARVAFAVASGVDSRVILDQPGAERLLGSGDMLFQAPDAPAPVRLQGVYVSEPEIFRLVNYWRALLGTAEKAPVAASGVVDQQLPRGVPLKQMAIWSEMKREENVDPLLDEAVDLIRRQGRASISMLQRRLRIGYTRAARLIETMEGKGIVGPPAPGSQAREVLDYGPAAPPADD